MSAQGDVSGSGTGQGPFLAGLHNRAIGGSNGHGQNRFDDGAGLPEGWRSGVGIASMRERVAELGGDLVIEPNVPRGTRIAALLPVRELP